MKEDAEGARVWAKIAEELKKKRIQPRSDLRNTQVVYALRGHGFSKKVARNIVRFYES